MTIDDLRSLRDQRDKLAEEVLEAMKEVFPIGEIFTFKKGGNTIRAEILDHGNIASRPDLRVRNIKTGKWYWIDLYYFLLSRKLC
jgi:hypothetical protein